METVDQHWTFTIGNADGQGSVSVGLDDPWASVFRQAATTGKRTGSWTGFGFRYSGVPYSFGFIGLSNKTRRFLWFPTASVAATLYDEDASGQMTHYIGRRVDHLTLDPEGKPGRHRSHFTYDDGTHGPIVPHYPNPAQLLPWFSMFLPNLGDHLRVVPESLAIRFPAVRTDTGYPAQLAGDAGGWVIEDARESLDVPCFVQFDVWAGMWPGWVNDSWGFMPAARQMGFISPGPDIRCRAIVHPLGEDRGCVIVMSWVPGQLDKPRILRPSQIHGTIPPLQPG